MPKFIAPNAFQIQDFEKIWKLLFWSQLFVCYLLLYLVNNGYSINSYRKYE